TGAKQHAPWRDHANAGPLKSLGADLLGCLVQNCGLQTAQIPGCCPMDVPAPIPRLVPPRGCSGDNFAALTELDPRPSCSPLHSIPSSSLRSRRISSSSARSRPRITFGGSCSTASYTTSLYRLILKSYLCPRISSAGT